jgi:hypothetical protein
VELTRIERATLNASRTLQFTGDDNRKAKTNATNRRIGAQISG